MVSVGQPQKLPVLQGTSFLHNILQSLSLLYLFSSRLKFTVLWTLLLLLVCLTDNPIPFTFLYIVKCVCVQWLDTHRHSEGRVCAARDVRIINAAIPSYVCQAPQGQNSEELRVSDNDMSVHNTPNCDTNR